MSTFRRDWPSLARVVAGSALTGGSSLTVISIQTDLMLFFWGVCVKDVARQTQRSKQGGGGGGDVTGGEGKGMEERRTRRLQRERSKAWRR